jgi:hypothetical protein
MVCRFVLSTLCAPSFRPKLISNTDASFFDACRFVLCFDDPCGEVLTEIEAVVTVFVALDFSVYVVEFSFF